MITLLNNRKEQIFFPRARERASVGDVTADASKPATKLDTTFWMDFWRWRNHNTKG